MLNKYTWLLFLGISQWCFIANAQDTTSFFPHQVGNLWEYYLYTDFVNLDTFQIYITSDSIDDTGNHHVIVEGRWIPKDRPSGVPFEGSYLIDTLGQVFMPTGSTHLLYKLNAEEGDFWQIDSFPGAEYALVDSIWEDLIFGSLFTFKQYAYYNFIDPTDTTLGINLWNTILGKGIGIVYLGGGDAFAEINIRGAVINEVLYGDTTSNIVSIENSLFLPPQEIVLHQNYPNPFNSQTTIQFRQKNTGTINLIIFDIAGKMVNRIISNQLFPSGEHQVMWNGKDQKGGDVTSGVYIYQLISRQHKFQRLMLLIR